MIRYKITQLKYNMFIQQMIINFTDIFTKQIEKEAFSINHDVQVGRS